MIFQQLAKDSTIYGGADFLTKMLAFFTFPLIAAALSPKAFGAMELIVTVTALAGLVSNCGLNNAVQRFYWDKDTISSVRPAIVTTGYITQMGFGLVAVIVGFILLPMMLPLTINAGWPLSWIALVSALLVMALSQWSQYALDVTRLHFKPWRFFAIALSTRVIVMILAVIAVVVMGWGVDGLFATQALGLLLILPIAIWFIRQDVDLKKWDWQWSRDLIRFGYPFIFAGIAYWLFGSMDRWMLAAMTSVEEVGIYSVAFRFASIVLFFSMAFGQAWSPIAIKIRTDQPQKYRIIFGQVLILLFFIMLIVGGGLALFSGELIYLIMPEEYFASALPLSILCFGIILQSTQQVTGIGISLEKKTYLFARYAWLTAFVNLFGNYALIPRFGAAGAATASVISYFVLTICYLYSTQRLHPIVIKWQSLLSLFLLGLFVAAISIIYLSQSIQIDYVLTKLFVASVCILFGWFLMPRNLIKGSW